jgi:hypothetical protein
MPARASGILGVLGVGGGRRLEVRVGLARQPKAHQLVGQLEVRLRAPAEHVDVAVDAARDQDEIAVLGRPA